MKKLLRIKKKPRSTGRVPGDDPVDEPGYSAVKEKDLPKLHKAAWNGDLPKIRQLVNKSGKKGEDLNQLDKQNRLVSLVHNHVCHGNVFTLNWRSFPAHP
jgi:hypothetical protein